MYGKKQRLIFFLFVFVLKTANTANWAQLAGQRAQNTATPYIPQKWYTDANSTRRPMWTARWGHALVAVLNHSLSNLGNGDHAPVNENRERVQSFGHTLVLLGGDDYDNWNKEDLLGLSDIPRQRKSGTGDEAAGDFRNDVWISEISSRGQEYWAINKRYESSSENLNFRTVRSEMTWHQTNPGSEAPTTWPSGAKIGQPLTYDEWIICQDYFDGVRSNEFLCNDSISVCFQEGNVPQCRIEATFKQKNMWSPRRGHAAFVANKSLYIIGGRAREHVRTNDSKQIEVFGNTDEPAKEYPPVREMVVLKNDVWISDDGTGKEWRLLTPGCRDQQEDVLIQTEVWSRNHYDPSTPAYAGSHGAICSTSSDCYGQSECKVLEGMSNKVCVCSMFSMREHHAVAVQNRYFHRKDGTKFSEDYIYLVGGFTNVRQAFCNDRACGLNTSYRLAVDDVWVSNDGISWVQMKPAFDSKFRGRGAHAAILTHTSPPLIANSSMDRLWIFGGETSDPQKDQVDHLNDIWNINIPSEPCCLTNNDCHSSPHAITFHDIGHCLPESSDWNIITQNATWTGRSGHTVVHEPSSLINNFTDMLYLIGGKNDNGVLSDVWTWDFSEARTWQLDFDLKRKLKRGNNISTHHKLIHSRDSPHWKYVTEKSYISMLTRSYLPVVTEHSEGVAHFPIPKPLLTNEEVDTLHDLGVHTIGDLSNADLHTILKLRGFDYSWEDNKLISNICYVKAITDAVITKCEVYHTTEALHTKLNDHSICSHDEEIEKCLILQWDGCAPISGLEEINIHGLGNVTVPQASHNTLTDLQEIFCRQTPGERYMAAGQFIDGKIILAGGKGSRYTSHYQDVWYRDNTFPQANITTRPESNTPQSIFVFDSNEDGSFQFEYKIFDTTERLDVTPWLASTINNGADISWLDSKRDGPGSGWYTIYVRTVDPSGNRDNTFVPSVNVYTWFYVQPLPWGWISGAIVAFLAFISIGYVEYRRRERRAALERYTIRRRRRKFKLKVMSEGGEGDWKNYYHNQKHGRGEDTLGRVDGKSNTIEDCESATGGLSSKYKNI